MSNDNSETSNVVQYNLINLFRLFSVIRQYLGPMYVGLINYLFLICAVGLRVLRPLLAHCTSPG
jgi:hypothetical protein